MKLKDFISRIEKISKEVVDSNKIDVRMADNLAIVDLILKDKSVYITDVSKMGSIKKCKN